MLYNMWMRFYRSADYVCYLKTSIKENYTHIMRRGSEKTRSHTHKSNTV